MCSSLQTKCAGRHAITCVVTNPSCLLAGRGLTCKGLVQGSSHPANAAGWVDLCEVVIVCKAVHNVLIGILKQGEGQALRSKHNAQVRITWCIA
jgi:hypothetical protein